MKSIVIYDSTFGNTKKIAETISKGLGKDSKAVYVSDLNKKDLKNIDLLVVGSPIIGWKPSEKTGSFLQSLSKDELKLIKAASFDTRVKLFIHGDATKQISDALKNAGAEIISPPYFFYVKGKEGPLLHGEEKRAEDWAKSLFDKAKN